ncbi:hypothetical protein J4219_02250 [Candidatus Woesearchaeota archaeon]|nr:hypothetical protein [Candidatus Woesearchaeota archaeon]
MDLHEALAKLTRHSVFKDWQKTNKDAFLAHAFVMLDEANKDVWQIGFYTKETERMVTFMVAETITHTPEQEVLKTDGEIEKLDVAKIKISVEEALSTAKKCVTENYGKENTFKQFFIIQTIEHAPIFNITYLTQSFKTINIKIDAHDGKILKQNIQALAEFG